MWATIGVLLAYEHGGLKPRGRKKGQTPRNRTEGQLAMANEYVPVRAWLLHSEHFFAVPGRKEAFRRLCQKLRIEPVFNAGPEWFGMWATIGVLLAYEHGGLKPRGPKKSQTPRNRIDIELVEAIEYLVEKRNLSFEHLLPFGIKRARQLKKLTAHADRTTDIKRLKRVKRLLDEKRRPPAGLLHLLMSDGDLD
jgi:hypothetical protein